MIYNSFMSELNLMIVYQLPAKKYDKIPGIRDLLENNDVPRKDALFKMIDLAEAGENMMQPAFWMLLIQIWRY